MIKLTKQALQLVPRVKPPAYIQSNYYTDLLDKTCDKKYLTPRTGVHLSDLCGSCPKKAAFTALDKSRKLSKRSKNYFFSGEAVDEKLRKMFTDEVPGHYDTSRTVTLGPVTARPDLYDIDRDTVIEIKSTDPAKYTKLPRSHQLQQLMGYMAVMDVEKGVLWYYILSRKQDDGFWQEYHISLSQSDRQELRNEILDDAMRQEGAINTKNPDLARNVADDPSYEWLCKGYCEYVDKCPQGYAVKERYFKAKADGSNLIKGLQQMAAAKAKLTK